MAVTGKSEAIAYPGSESTRLILLHEQDSVLVCAKPIVAGEIFYIDSHRAEATTTIEVGHKLARVALAVGDRIIKYGVPIGSATSPIEIGQHVHLHNMRSDYIPGPTRSSLNRNNGQ